MVIAVRAAPTRRRRFCPRPSSNLAGTRHRRARARWARCWRLLPIPDLAGLVTLACNPVDGLQGPVRHSYWRTLGLSWAEHSLQVLESVAAEREMAGRESNQKMENTLPLQ